MIPADGRGGYPACQSIRHPGEPCAGHIRKHLAFVRGALQSRRHAGV